jgi:3-hydroxyisobutyrate dehydrogenase
MGLPMARHLAHAGHTLRVWNRSREKAEALAGEGATVCGDPREAAAGAELIVTMLSDSSSVLDTASQALEGAGPGVVWAQMSTIGEEGIEYCLTVAERHGVELVDAPVLGTREPAEQAKLVVLAAGHEGALERCAPVFDAVGARTIRVGEEPGAATRAKLVVNGWVLGVTGLVAETIALAQALEVDPQVFFDAVEGGPLDLPYARLKGQAMIDRSFDDAAFRLALARKDGDLVMSAADRVALESPILEAVAERLRRAEADGHGDEDMAATYLATAPDPARR